MLINEFPVSLLSFANSSAYRLLTVCVQLERIPRTILRICKSVSGVVG